MSYHVNKKIKKNGALYWRLLRSEWSGGKVKYHHIPASQMLQHGLSPELSVEEAIAKVKQLNAQSSAGRDDERRKAGTLRNLARRGKLESAHLPPTFVQEFVSDYLRAEMELGARGKEKYAKALSQWERAKRIIVAVNLPQQHWFQHKRRFFNELVKAKLSPSYSGKVMRVLNLWGIFMAMKSGTSFIPLPPPRGYDREQIADAHRESGKRSKESLPLSPAELEAARARLDEPAYRWLYLSVWLGLRPGEVDRIKEAKLTKEQGVPVLWVQQTKTQGIAHAKRVKPIPLICRQQVKCLDFLKQEIKRPLVKTVQKHVGEGLNLYGGRKGFTDLMLGLGQSLEDVSTWLGHSTIERTWKSYKQRQRVSFRKVG